MSDVIEHGGIRYEIVRCHHDLCSFYKDACDRALCDCMAPAWWRKIHTTAQLGLRELSPANVPVPPRRASGSEHDRRCLRRIYRLSSDKSIVSKGV